MKCAYCGTEIAEGTGLFSDGKYFCNPLHRYSWQGDSPAESAKSFTKSPAALLQTLSLSGSRWKKQLAVGITAVGAVLGSIFGTQIASRLFSSNVSIDAQLTQFASEFNKSCPIHGRQGNEVG